MQKAQRWGEAPDEPVFRNSELRTPHSVPPSAFFAAAQQYRQLCRRLKAKARLVVASRRRGLPGRSIGAKTGHESGFGTGKWASLLTSAPTGDLSCLATWILAFPCPFNHQHSTPCPPWPLAKEDQPVRQRDTDARFSRAHTCPMPAGFESEGKPLVAVFRAMSRGQLRSSQIAILQYQELPHLRLLRRCLCLGGKACEQVQIAAKRLLVPEGNRG